MSVVNNTEAIVATETQNSDVCVSAAKSSVFINCVVFCHLEIFNALLI
jgi:hypothetical protein